MILLLIFSLLVLPLQAADDEQNGEAQFISNTRQLIYEGKRSGEGYFSPDGNALIFQSEREPGNPFFQIYILDLLTGDSHRVSPGTGKTTCAFFRPGHDEVLFASTHLDPDAEKKQKQEYKFRAEGKSRRYSWDYDKHMDIFSTARDGSQLKRLTQAPGYDAEGSYSPDGSKIVFASLRDIYAAESLTAEDDKRLEMDPAYYGEIYIMDADGSEQTRLTDWPGYDGGPFFTPDGKRIVWRHFEENGAVADVYTMRLDGSDIRRITDFKAMSWAPYFHPSGKYAIFASNKLGFSNFELYMVDAAGQHEPVQVTYTDGFDGLPVFSPDGNKLCWTSNRTSEKESQLFMANWNHEKALEALRLSPASQINTGSTNAEDKKDAGSGNLVPEITQGDLKQIVGYLASDELEGRMTGKPGEKKAADYIAAEMKKIGLLPAGDNNTYFHEFQFTAGIEMVPEQNRLTISAENWQADAYEVDTDFRPLGFTENGEIEGEVVFAGYGLSVPGQMGVGYDSYTNLDVDGKIVLVLRYVPEDVDVDRRQELNRYAGLRYKALVAREHGAKGLLVFTGPNSPKTGELVDLKFDVVSAGSGIIAASINEDVARTLFKTSGKDLEEVQTELDRDNPHYEGTFALPGVKVKLATGVKRIEKTGRNVVGLLRGSSDPPPQETIVVGAHFDHIGYGEIGSLAHKGEEEQIHNGADDNASGTSVVMELMAALAKNKNEKPQDFKRNILFGLWSGEELGLIGSTKFVENSEEVDNAVAYLNFDMVGRLRDNTLILQGIGSSDSWTRMIEKRNVVAGFDLNLQDDPYLPTDATAFYNEGVPILSFFTGSHEDYNRPTDDAETLNYEGMDRIARFAQLIIKDLMKNPDPISFVKVEQTKSKGGDRETLRAYLGTIPDYVSEGTGGVKLSGVRAGGPADKAGLQGDDIIIKFAGQNITNIYDYTYALDAVKIGEAIEVVVIRDGEELTLTVIPEARP